MYGNSRVLKKMLQITENVNYGNVNARFYCINMTALRVAVSGLCLFSFTIPDFTLLSFLKRRNKKCFSYSNEQVYDCAKHLSIESVTIALFISVEP
jgi:hypothetical protein